MKVVIAIPTRDQIPYDVVSTLLHISHDCRTKNIGCEILPCKASPCWLARDICVRDFMKTGDNPEDKLFFLDDDTSVHRASIMKLFESAHPISACAYRKKLGVDTLDQEYVVASRAYPAPDADGFAVLDRVGAGCLCISRGALIAMHLAHADMEFETPVEGRLWGLFRESFWPGFVSEDYSFCDRARAAGIFVHVLVDAISGHQGTARWVGNMAQHYPTMMSGCASQESGKMKAFRTSPQLPRRKAKGVKAMAMKLEAVVQAVNELERRISAQPT